MLGHQENLTSPSVRFSKTLQALVKGFPGVNTYITWIQTGFIVGLTTMTASHPCVFVDGLRASPYIHNSANVSWKLCCTNQSKLIFILLQLVFLYFQLYVLHKCSCCFIDMQRACAVHTMPFAPFLCPFLQILSAHFQFTDIWPHGCVSCSYIWNKTILKRKVASSINVSAYFHFKLFPRGECPNLSQKPLIPR